MKHYKRKFKEGIDLYSDVFNIKDEELKKIKKLFTKYDIDYSDIQKAEKQGIMSIFDHTPSNTEFLFAVLVSMIKNNDIR